MVRSTRYTLLALTVVLLLVSAGVAFAQGGGGGRLSLAAAVAPAGPPKIDVHGYMQNRVYSGSGLNPQFRSERISISTLATFANNSNAYVEVYYHPWVNTNGLYLESAYYDAPVGDGRIRVGKGRRTTFGMTPAYPNRKTSNYGIVSEAFTQDRIQGIQYMSSKGSVDLGLSVHTGYRLGNRGIGEVPGDAGRNATHSVPHLALRDPHSGGGNPNFLGVSGQLSRKLQFSGRLGTNWSGLKAGLSASIGTLDPRDLTNMRTVAGAGGYNPLAVANPLDPSLPIEPLLSTATSRDMNQWGLDVTKLWPCGLVTQGEFYEASASNLDYNAWNVLGGFVWPTGWKLFARYSQQNMHTPRTNNPLTWDVQQISLSLVQPLGKSVWIQYEYELNDENTNTGATVSNNLFFVELFTGF